MSGLDHIIEATVNRQTRAPTQKGFGTPLLIAYHELYGDLLREYGELSELTDEGFSADSSVYRMAAALKSQDTSPKTFWVGRRKTAFTQVVHLIPRNTTVGFVHSITIDDIEYTYEVQPSDTVALIVDGLLSEIAAADDVTATDGTTHAICTSDTEGAIHKYKAKKGLDLYDATANPGGFAQDLADIAADNPEADWYGVLLDCNSEAQITPFATWLETNLALGLVQSADWDVKDAGQSGDIATAMRTAAWKRTSGIYCGQIGMYSAAGWMGGLLPRNPGRATWAHKTITGIDTDALSTGQRTAIEDKNWSHYTRTGGLNVTFESKTPAGEFIDIIQGVDFSTARIKEALFGQLANNEKIPQTEAGITSVRGTVLSVLKQCSGADFPIYDPTTITTEVPKIDEIPTADRANRILPNIRYSARLQGAFHRFKVIGNVYV
jgi:hypothetical protein